MCRKSFADLESAALEAHQAGVTWSDFWRCVAGDVERLFPRCPQRRDRMVHQLLAIVINGHDRGQQPVGLAEWEREATVV